MMREWGVSADTAHQEEKGEEETKNKNECELVSVAGLCLDPSLVTPLSYLSNTKDRDLEAFCSSLPPPKPAHSDILKELVEIAGGLGGREFREVVVIMVRMSCTGCGEELFDFLVDNFPPSIRSHNQTKAWTKFINGMKYMSLMIKSF